MSGLYAQNFSPARAISPHIRTTPDVDSGQYMTELLEEHQKLGPFNQVLPICSRLLNQALIVAGGSRQYGEPSGDGHEPNSSIVRLDWDRWLRMKLQESQTVVESFLPCSDVKEILRVSGMIPNQGFSDFDRLQRGSVSPMASSEILASSRGTSSIGWKGLPQERLGAQGMNVDWQAAPASPSSYIVKKILRLDIPVDSYPTFNFVGRLLGPRGNSLKRVEASTGCRVYIRGQGSIKDPEKEDSLRGRPGYEHLSDPLHILIEAELPVNVVDLRLRQAQEIIEELLKPVDESQDIYKRQQLRELAMLNSNYREESPRPSGSVSPFTSSGMKRAKTGQ